MEWGAGGSTTWSRVRLYQKRSPEARGRKEFLKGSRWIQDGDFCRRLGRPQILSVRAGRRQRSDGSCSERRRCRRKAARGVAAALVRIVGCHGTAGSRRLFLDEADDAHRLADEAFQLRFCNSCQPIHRLNRRRSGAVPVAARPEPRVRQEQTVIVTRSLDASDQGPLLRNRRLAARDSGQDEDRAGCGPQHVFTATAGTSWSSSRALQAGASIC